MFNSTKLKQVVHVARAGSFSAAAAALNITQSTLTKAVADVEQDLGFTLYHRTAKGVITTPEGREFLARAERIVADFELLVEDTNARKVESETYLRIGISPASLEGLYNRVIANLLSEHTHICLTVVTAPVERGISLLKRGDLDLLLGPTERFNRESDFVTEPFATLDSRLFCRIGHPILSQDEISFDDISTYKIVTPDLYSDYSNRLTKLMTMSNFEPRQHLHIIENFSVVSEVVANSNLFGIVSASYAQSRSFQSRFVLPPIDVFEPLELGAARLARWTPNRNVRACLAELRQHPIDRKS